MSTRETSDFGTDEVRDRMGGVIIGYTADGLKIARGKYQNRFDYLLHKTIISDKQHEAGERLRVDAYRSGKFAYVRSSADHSVRGNIPDSPAEFIIRARENFKAALGMMTAEEIKIVNVYVIDDGYLEVKRAAREKNMMTLRSGLDALIKFYGI